ncbi:hypothetical protein [Parendozoicomonas sp. Alg238-R29]|uniref:hypothetical protein n=1 Tax=Parendozoicomonas sp. Alg238-R29 TaxID=2993446 RepID=UPI00248E3B5A|nr:hypothetical protein [Parendozoicomonas sp. Alg238-R29]
MRLAFDKPTIIIKDDKTSYSFDTSPIEHLEYPRDLRFTKIVEFKKALSEKIKATLKKSEKDPSYTTFLGHFGTFTVAKLDTKEVSKEDFIIEELKDLKKSVQRQEMINSERIHMSSPSMYGKYPPDRTFMEMRRAIKKVIGNEFPECSSSDINKPEFKEIIFHRIMDNERVRKFFAGPEEMQSVFQDAYANVAA